MGRGLPVFLIVGLAVLSGAVLLAVPRAGAEQQSVTMSPVTIEDPSGGKALATFAAALRKTAAGGDGAVTRVAHYGDSLVVVDKMTSVLRRQYQARYGDAGPGFVLALRPWDWYRRHGVRHRASDGWKIYRSISGGPADRFYGYGGVAFVARRSGREASFTTTTIDEQPVKVSALDVHYLEQPGGGDFEVLVDGERIAEISTAADTAGSAFRHLAVADGRHEIKLRTLGRGPVRLFGVALERGGPGVVYDSLGLNGTCMSVMGRINEGHLAEQFQHRRPDLIVLNFGTAESKRPGLVRRYRQSILPIAQRLRRISGEASCLIIGPMDRGQRQPDGRVESNLLIPRIIATQREVAAEVGCGFYDTYTAMGGKGAMRRWERAGLASHDLSHLSTRGAKVMGEHLFEALEAAAGAAATD